MLYQPIMCIFLACLILTITHRYNYLFRIISIIYPVCAFLALMANNSLVNLKFLGFSFTIQYLQNYKPVGYALLIACLSINLYLTSQSKKFEIIIGGFYLLFSMICLFANDLITMFISLELMVICSTILLYIGNSRYSLIAAKQYLLTHLFSANLILIGICYFLNLKEGTEILNLSNLFFTTTTSSIMYGCMLFGCLINVAAVPFSSWLINCYPESNSGGFLYLVSFSTKISTILILKLFSGMEILKYFGIIMMLYGGSYACIESNLRRIFCYLSMAQTGFIISIVSVDYTHNLDNTVICIAINIIYKLIIGMYHAYLNDYSGIKEARQVCRTSSILLNYNLLVGFLMIINFPLAATYLSKISIIFDDKGIFYAQHFLNVIIFFALPIKNYIHNKIIYPISLNKVGWTGLFLPSIAIIIINIYLLYNVINLEGILKISLHYKNILMQAILIIVMFGLACNINIPRMDTRKLSIDLLFFISNFSRNLLKFYINHKNYSKKLFKFELSSDKIIKYLGYAHTQSAAIGVIFIMFIILILTQSKG